MFIYMYIHICVCIKKAHTRELRTNDRARSPWQLAHIPAGPSLYTPKRCNKTYMGQLFEIQLMTSTCHITHLCVQIASWAVNNIDCFSQLWEPQQSHARPFLLLSRYAGLVSLIVYNPSQYNRDASMPRAIVSTPVQPEHTNSGLCWCLDVMCFWKNSNIGLRQLSRG